MLKKVCATAQKMCDCAHLHILFYCTFTLAQETFYLNEIMNMEEKGKILIVDDNEDVLFALNLLLKPYMESIKVATTPEKIIPFMQQFAPDVILLDMNFAKDAISGREGFYWLGKILEQDAGAVVLLMTAYADTDKAVAAIKAGATDFVPKPWEKEKLLATLSSALKLRRERERANRLQEQVELLGAGEEEPMIGHSPAMLNLMDTIDKLSGADANILILGENGTGKDLAARSLWRHSPRAGRPLVTIDLGTIPEQLFESELFGYERGAFTDARKSKAGRIEVADGGTLFLDEIGNLTPTMQAKLLAAIERHEITRLGATAPRPIDVRLISATNSDLYGRVAEGSFRQDLLYRINTIELHIPPLRERGDDILLLASYFATRYARKYKKEIEGLRADAKSKLLHYEWPGNVRELQHAIERAVILAPGRMLGGDLFQLKTPLQPAKAAVRDSMNIEEIERATIQRALLSCEGNVSRAAEEMGISRFILYRKMKKYGL